MFLLMATMLNNTVCVCVCVEIVIISRLEKKEKWSYLNIVSASFLNHHNFFKNLNIVVHEPLSSTKTEENIDTPL